MEQLDSNAIVDFGLALGRLAGETVDETDFRKWVDEKIGIIERKDAEFSQSNPDRGCRVIIRTSYRPVSTGGAYSSEENMVLFRRVTSNQGTKSEGSDLAFTWALANFDDCPEPGGPIGDYGICCYQIGSTRLCIEWTCSVFDYEAYPLI